MQLGDYVSCLYSPTRSTSEYSVCIYPLITVCRFYDGLKLGRLIHSMGSDKNAPLVNNICYHLSWGRRMAVGFTTTFVISDYHR
jgi:hypothetical protein